MDTPSDLGGSVLSIEMEDQQTIIPDFEIDALAHCLLPKIQAYFANPEGQAAFEEWKRQQNYITEAAPSATMGPLFLCADIVQIKNKSEPVPNGKPVRIIL